VTSTRVADLDQLLGLDPELAPLGEELAPLLVGGLDAPIGLAPVGHRFDQGVVGDELAAGAEVPLRPFGVNGADRVSVALRHRSQYPARGARPRLTDRGPRIGSIDPPRPPFDRSVFANGP
jgi:hypothetical protein